MDHAEDRELERALKIRLVAAVYFCASKIEAFADRGKNDFPASRDLEDLIAVVDGRAELAGEIEAAANDVRSYLAKEIEKLLLIREFNDAVPGYVPPDAARQERIGTIISRLSVPPWVVVKSVYVGNFRAKQQDLRRVINPDQKDDQGRCRPISGCQGGMAQIEADEHLTHCK
jgi:hypothetical protein